MIAQWLTALRRRYYRFRDQHGNLRRIECALRRGGCEYGTDAFSPAYVLYFCTCCKKELLGRPLDTLNNMPSMPDELREHLDFLEQYQ